MAAHSTRCDMKSQTRLQNWPICAPDPEEFQVVAACAESAIRNPVTRCRCPRFVIGPRLELGARSRRSCAAPCSIGGRAWQELIRLRLGGKCDDRQRWRTPGCACGRSGFCPGRVPGRARGRRHGDGRCLPGADLGRDGPAGDRPGQPGQLASPWPRGSPAWRASRSWRRTWRPALTAAYDELIGPGRWQIRRLTSGRRSSCASRGEHDRANAGYHIEGSYAAAWRPGHGT